MALALTIRSFEQRDTESVIALWNKCGLVRPWNDPQLDILRKQSVGADLFLVALQANDVVASVMGGYDGHRGWMNYLAVDPDCQRGGYARQLVTHLEQRLKAVGCPKLNLQVRKDNTSVIEFYQHLGYNIDEVTSFGKRLIADSDTGS
jgi:ribosomal protein S18 acetylase RimI-like enzyme